MMAILRLLSISTLIFTISSLAIANDFPTHPDPIMTPGSVCNDADENRYPEGIAYCERDVETRTKREIIRRYDAKLGFHIQSMNRNHFKIDHLIPLCAGGSNEVSNLWPQHRSIYELTDPLEPLLCEKMARGRIRQKDAITFIIQAKMRPEKAPEAYRYLRQL